MNLVFTKMHGLGNDFIVIEDLAEEWDLAPEAVEWFCDRRFGIGADGLMLIRPAINEGSAYSWWFANSDGTQPEMCGNGIRCFARYICEHGMIEPAATQVTLDTLRGPMPISIERDEQGAFVSATVDMGFAGLSPADIPTTLPTTDHPSVVDAPLEIGNLVYNPTCVSMGNPHTVLFCEDLGCNVLDAPVDTLGPIIEIASQFPQKTNVEFVSVESRTHIAMRVWERGVGETMACGTGACAVAVAAYLKGMVDTVVDVELPGGILTIEIEPETMRVLMTGSAEEVYTGTLVIDED